MDLDRPAGGPCEGPIRIGMRRLGAAVAHRLGLRPAAAGLRLGDGANLARLSTRQLETVRLHFPRPKFFVFGHARSGTTLLGRLIRLHPEVHCEWQAQIFSRHGPIPYLAAPGLLAWLRHPANHWAEYEDPTTLLIRIYCDGLLEAEADRVGKRVVGDKSTNGNGAEAVRWLGAVYPDSHLLFIVRDGRDTILSKRIQAFLDQPQSLPRPDQRMRSEVLRDPRLFLDGRRSLFTPEWLEAAAGKWAADVHTSVAAGREILGDRFLTIRYEDLVAKPGGWMRRIWSFLEVEEGDLEAQVMAEMLANPAAEWHENVDLNFARSLPRGVPGAWRSIFTVSDAHLFERIAGAELRAWNYEASPVPRP